MKVTLRLSKRKEREKKTQKKLFHGTCQGQDFLVCTAQNGGLKLPLFFVIVVNVVDVYLLRRSGGVG